MLLDLRGFRGGTEEVARQYTPEAFTLEGEDFRIVAPVKLTARVSKDAQKVRVSGRVQTVLETDCGRCLEPFLIPVDAKLDLMFLPDTGDGVVLASGEKEVREEDTGVSFYKDETIDLGEMMRDEFYLALPMKPLCKDDCKGLCPVCGVNWNRDACTCKAEWVDPRMAALQDLKKLLD